MELEIIWSKSCVLGVLRSDLSVSVFSNFTGQSIRIYTSDPLCWTALSRYLCTENDNTCPLRNDSYGIHLWKQSFLIKLHRQFQTTQLPFMIKTIYEMLQVSTHKGQRQAEKCSIFTKENFFCNKIQVCCLELYSLLSLWNRGGALSKDFVST